MTEPDHLLVGRSFEQGGCGTWGFEVLRRVGFWGVGAIRGDDVYMPIGLYHKTRATKQGNALETVVG